MVGGLVQGLQAVPPPTGRDDEPTGPPKVHLSVAPVYYHNYVLGHLAAQLRRRLESGAVVVRGESFHGSELPGRYLREAVFGAGARETWKTTVVRATGEPLDHAYLVQTLV